MMYRSPGVLTGLGNSGWPYDQLSFVPWLMLLASQYLYYWFRVTCKPRLKCSLGSLARLSTLSQGYLLMASIYIFVLSSVYLVEYTLHQNLMIEIYTRNFDLHITVPSPNLAFLCRNLDYKPYSINQPWA